MIQLRRYVRNLVSSLPREQRGLEAAEALATRSLEEAKLFPGRAPILRIPTTLQRPVHWQGKLRATGRWAVSQGAARPGAARRGARHPDISPGAPPPGRHVNATALRAALRCSAPFDAAWHRLAPLYSAQPRRFTTHCAAAPPGDWRSAR